MDISRIYHPETPDFLRECAATPPLARLGGVGMNCGCEYTAFPRFAGLTPYSRLTHSLGVALIVWRFTGEERQALAGLLHDIATPVFAHVVDFMRGDYLRQESTEAGTEALIRGSAELLRLLSARGLCVEDVCDYHMYPIADNDSPRLSADRLEYTLSNSVNYGICSERQAAALYGDLTVCVNEEGRLELAFRSFEAAEAFAGAALDCAEIYVSDEDRCAMQILAELLRSAVAWGVLREDDLYTTEPEVIARLLRDERTAALWRRYRACGRMLRADAPGETGEWRQVRAKKRWIDPLVLNRGRVTALSPAFARRARLFLEAEQDAWLCAEPWPQDMSGMEGERRQ